MDMITYPCCDYRIIMDMITYPCGDLSQTMLVNGATVSFSALYRHNNDFTLGLCHHQNWTECSKACWCYPVTGRFQVMWKAFPVTTSCFSSIYNRIHAKNPKKTPTIWQVFVRMFYSIAHAPHGCPRYHLGESVHTHTHTHTPLIHSHTPPIYRYPHAWLPTSMYATGTELWSPSLLSVYVGRFTMGFCSNLHCSWGRWWEAF